MKSLIALFKV